MLSSKFLVHFILQSIFLVIFLPHSRFCADTDTITKNLVIKDPHTITSSGNIFRFGFFSPDNTTKNRYLGIYYTFSESTVVWVANRGRPIADSSGSVTISGDGNIVVMNRKGEIFWSSNVTTSTINSSAQLMDTGNLVLRENSSGNSIWESFLHPCDVFLPAAKVIDIIKTGNKVVMSSWKNPSNPDVGNFTTGIESINIPQSFIWNGNRPHWRSGPWNGQIPLGIEEAYSSVYMQEFNVAFGPNGTFSVFVSNPDKNVFSKLDLNSTGSLIRSWWDAQTKKWDKKWFAPKNKCEVYGTCGPFGSCNVKSSPICSCLKGFEPKDLEEWRRGIWAGGCVRRKSLACQLRNINNTGSGPKEDRFLRLPLMKVPDFPEQGPFSPIKECRKLCSKNCSCIAYAHETNLGCMFWTQDLIDIQQFSKAGMDLYIRLESSELDKSKEKMLVIIIVPILGGLIAILICIFISWWSMTNIARQKGSN